MKYISRVLIAMSLLALAWMFVAHDAESAKPKPRSDANLSGAKSTATRPAEEKHTPAREPERVPSKSALDQISQPQSEPINTVAPLNTTPMPQTSGAQSAAAIQNNWISINQGGATEVSNGNLKLGISIAQPVAGYVESGNLALGLGYWYGAAAGGGGGCVCTHQCDFDENNLIDAVDMNGLIDIMFFGETNIKEATCPTFRMDFDCSGLVDAVDLNWIIDYQFFGGPPPCNPCTCPPGSCTFP